MRSDVSAVIVAKNEELHIAEVIENVRRAGPREVIVVDNASTDKTAETARSMGVRVVHCPGRLGEARNVGWMAASGDFVCFIDADMRIPADYFDWQFTEDIVYGARRLPVSYTNRLGMLEWMVNDSYLRRKGEFGCGCSVFPKSLLERVRGFNPGLRAGEDAELFERLERMKIKRNLMPKAVLHIYLSDWATFFRKTAGGRTGRTHRWRLLSRLLFSPVRGAQMAAMYHELLLVFYYPLRLFVMLFGGLLWKLSR